MEKEIQIRPVNDSDAEFLYQLMNCPSLLERLNEVPTTRQDWTDAISEWLKDEDEEDYIVLAGDTPMGWLGVNGLRGGNGIAYLKMAAILRPKNRCPMNGNDYRKTDFTGGVALVIGAEEDGISRLVAEKCDYAVSLPMKGKIESLNASVAAGIMMYRVLECRQ